MKVIGYNIPSLNVMQTCGLQITKASLSFRLSPALLICPKGLWGKGNPRKWSNFAVLRGPDPAAGVFLGGVLVRFEIGMMRGLL